MCTLPTDVKTVLDKQDRQAIENYLDERKGKEVLRSCH